MENLITTLVTEYGLTPIDILQTTFTVVITIYLLHVKVMLCEHIEGKKWSHKNKCECQNKHNENKGA